MPTSEEMLGFTNRWYPEALQNATAVEISSGVTVRVVTAPYFVATKLEAYKGQWRSVKQGLPCGACTGRDR